jgi:hypothetical protein
MCLLTRNGSKLVEDSENRQDFVPIYVFCANRYGRCGIDQGLGAQHSTAQRVLDIRNV